MRTLKKNKPLKGMSILLFLTFMGFARLMAQFYCGMDKIWQKHLGKSDRTANVQNFWGGRYVPISGVNKALVVFVRFPDDFGGNDCSEDESEWPASRAGLPSWAYNFIDNSATNTHTEGSITDYFCKMSRDQGDGEHGKFHLIGEVYPELVIPPHPRSYYPSGPSALKQVNHDVIQYII